MNNQHQNTRVPTVDEYLAPLADIRGAHLLQAEGLLVIRAKMNLMMTNVIKSHEALPMHLRPRQLFQLEESMNEMAESFRAQRDAIKVAITHLHSIAKDAMNVDPMYREGALRIVYEAEQIAKRNVETLETMLDEIDLSNSQLLTVH